MNGSGEESPNEPDVQGRRRARRIEARGSENAPVISSVVVPGSEVSVVSSSVGVVSAGGRTAESLSLDDNEDGLASIDRSNNGQLQGLQRVTRSKDTYRIWRPSSLLAASSASGTEGYSMILDASKQATDRSDTRDGKRENERRHSPLSRVVSVEVGVRDGSSLSTEVLEVLHGRTARGRTESKPRQSRATENHEGGGVRIQLLFPSRSVDQPVESQGRWWAETDPPDGGGSTQGVVASQRKRIETKNGRLRREVPARRVAEGEGHRLARMTANIVRRAPNEPPSESSLRRIQGTRPSKVLRTRDAGPCL